MNIAALLSPTIPPPPILDDPWGCCRFCLLQQQTPPPPTSPSLLATTTTFRHIPVDQLPGTDIPALFELCTAIKLDISAEYSTLLCAECERQMRLVADIRAAFVRVARQWKTILAGDDVDRWKTASNRRTGGWNEQVLKAERMDDDDEVPTTLAPKCQLQADESDDGDMKQEPCDYEYMEDNNGGTGDDSDDSAEDEEEDDDDDDDHDNDVDNNEDDDDDDEAETAKRTRRKREAAADEISKRRRVAGRKKKPDVPEQPLECDICKAKLKSRYLLLRHMRSAHNSKPSTTCHICGKTDLKRLNQHLRDHRKTDRYKCSHCPRAFARLAMLQQHERQHTGERPYICEVCAYTFTSPAALKRHARRHTDPHAGLTLSTNGTVIANPLPRAQQATRCQRRLAPVAVLLPKLPPRGGVRLECPLCGHTYVNRSSLQPHMRLQHGAEGLAAWKRVLETTCLVCARRFEDGAELQAHRVEHQAHQCGICKRRFQCARTLEMHVQKHSKKERRFECASCGALYTCAFTLRTHYRRAHTDERPYRCGQCALGFVERWELNSHMKKQHTFLRGLRPHECKVCGETFRTLDSLRVHGERHTGRFRYQCGVCLRNQHSGPLLVQHMQSYHAEEWRREEAELEERRRKGGGGAGGDVALDGGGGGGDGGGIEAE